MVSITVGGEYFPILQDHCISKAQIKVADTVDQHHAIDIIGGFYVSGQVWDEELCGGIFIYCVADEAGKFFFYKSIATVSWSTL